MLFLFFSHSDPAPSRVQALHSLLFQALKDEASLRPEVFAAYSANERKFGSNTGWVRGLLSKVLRDAPMFIVVDGLDELTETLRCDIARDLFEVVQSCDQVRLLVSSRDESDLRTQFASQRAVQIRVQENNSSDVKQYVRAECNKLVDRLRRFGTSDEECTQIQENSSTVVENANGTPSSFVLC